MKKYETVIESRTQFQKETGETIELYRIRALTSFADVQAGELGGYIEERGRKKPCRSHRLQKGE